MKSCSVPECNKKHHARGYCKYHYVHIYLRQKLSNTKCSVVGCDNPVSISFTKEKLCEMHGTRMKRSGSVFLRKRDRDIRSIAQSLADSENPLEFDMVNKNTFSEVSRIYYGDYCHECGWNLGPCEAHHIIPVSDGGKSSIGNCIVLCPNCHSLKHRNNRKRLSDKRKEEIMEIMSRVATKQGSR